MSSFFCQFYRRPVKYNPPNPEKLNLMKTEQHQPANPVFLQTVGVAVAQLKEQLQQDYEQAYPELHEVIHLVLDEEESNARELTMFPHLLLPDLVEAHIAKLDLRPVDQVPAGLHRARLLPRRRLVLGPHPGARRPPSAGPDADQRCAQRR